ncbi:MAG: cytochrome c maturation protein CcmE [Deferribacteraceae bacterium]|jgi:cytochrome c-type biogenesis protein CcmE|nr:cytochrome c maturation protein CcmE [Deferribacteraceae bacterium]
MKKNYIKYAVAFAVIAATLVYFIVSALSGEKIYYREVGELINNPLLAEKKGLRISGNVISDNFSVNKFEKYAVFEITDDTGAALPVVYNGTIPDAFEIGAAVLIEGSYSASENVFTAKKLLAKCPSKYEAEGEKHPDELPKK